MPSGLPPSVNHPIAWIVVLTSACIYMWWNHKKRMEEYEKKGIVPNWVKFKHAPKG